MFDKKRCIQVAAVRKFRDVVSKPFEPSQDGVVSATESQGLWLFQDAEGREYRAHVQASQLFRQAGTAITDLGYRQTSY